MEVSPVLYVPTRASLPLRCHTSYRHRMAHTADPLHQTRDNFLGIRRHSDIWLWGNTVLWPGLLGNGETVCNDGEVRSDIRCIRCIRYLRYLTLQCQGASRRTIG